MQKRKTDRLRGCLMLLLCALIWGTAFVAQSAGMDYVEPFTYNGIRTLIGGLVLLPVIALFDRLKPQSERPTREEKREIDRNSWKAGVICGLFLAFASSFQQIGISMTTAGKAGFVTALYVVIVPVLGIFLGKKVPKIVWLCVAAAVAGFWLLCVKEGFSVSTGDLLVLCCAFLFSFHILAVDRFNGWKVDGVRMSCCQFLTAGTLMLIAMAFTEHPTLSAIWDARVTILYAGVMSCGVAYTLQILGQKLTEPTEATLLMSLESVFAALSGWLLLDEKLAGREIFGCILVFAAVIFAQIPLPEFGKKENSSSK